MAFKVNKNKKLIIELMSWSASLCKFGKEEQKTFLKFGIQFFFSKQGRKFLENIKNDFWLDLKINDIPQTAMSAIDSLKDLKKCKYITVHANGGLEMLKAVKRKAIKINSFKKLTLIGSVCLILMQYTNYLNLN